MISFCPIDIGIVINTSYQKLPFGSGLSSTYASDDAFVSCLSCIFFPFVGGGGRGQAGSCVVSTSIERKGMVVMLLMMLRFIYSAVLLSHNATYR